MRHQRRVSAKHKLNAFHFNTVVIFAGLVGLATGSWAIFLIALTVLLVSRLYAGDIRQ